MSTKIQTEFGHALPPAPRHAITTHVPTWKVIEQFRDRDPELMRSFKSMYPRFWIHPDIATVSGKAPGATHSG